MNVAIAADHGGFALKEHLKTVLEELGIPYTDFGCHGEASVDYPDFAVPVAEAVAKGEYTRGVLICGTGLGMAITANKIPGIRAVTVHDTFSAKFTRLHNDSNVLTMGGRVIGPGLAGEVLRVWLETPFEGGRHQRRLDKIAAVEEKRPEIRSEAGDPACPNC
ncbi:MAG: ribose 5-phosphate isomerase B [Kyrpidia tusciae]|nr:ribose 5-phosphate isomerase B [Kyrpidia tusciae]MBE3552399.1 ribose 5-phosphate isomerase B [Kyrpidia tusciae]